MADVLKLNLLLKEYRHPNSSGRQPLWLSKTRTRKDEQMLKIGRQRRCVVGEEHQQWRILF